MKGPREQLEEMAEMRRKVESDRSKAELDRIRKENRDLRQALEDIRDRDWLENALDPQWAARIAKRTLDTQ